MNASQLTRAQLEHLLRAHRQEFLDGCEEHYGLPPEVAEDTLADFEAEHLAEVDA